MASLPISDVRLLQGRRAFARHPILRLFPEGPPCNLRLGVYRRPYDTPRRRDIREVRASGGRLHFLRGNVRRTVLYLVCDDKGWISRRVVTRRRRRRSGVRKSQFFSIGWDKGFRPYTAQNLAAYLSGAGAERAELLDLGNDQPHASSLAVHLQLTNDVGDLRNARACTCYTGERSPIMVNVEFHFEDGYSCIAQESPDAINEGNRRRRPETPLRAPLLREAGLKIHFRGRKRIIKIWGAIGFRADAPTF